MRTLQLNEHRDLFRDENAYAEFVRILREADDSDELRVIFADEDALGAVVGLRAIRERMQRRILNRFAGQPDLLDELRRRLEDDENLVD